MENSLELRHIAPYLPYKLRFFTDCEEYRMELDGLYVWGDAFNEQYGDIPLHNIRPILRPLEDYKLFEDITDMMIRREFGLLEDYPDLVLRLSYTTIEKMLEHHIDVFSLIPQNLAINLNTIV